MMRKEVLKAVGSSGNGQSENAPNPYLDARRHWNSQIDRAFASQHVWQLIGIAGFLIGLGGIAGITYVGSKSKFVPYVIEVDRLGEAVAVGPAQVAGVADSRVVRASLGAFIGNARLVTPDQDVQRKAIFNVYGMLKAKDPATAKMNEFLNGSEEASPFQRAARMTVNTSDFTVLPVTGTTWQVDWTETTRDRDGSLIGPPKVWRSTLEMYVEPPASDTKQIDIQRNPLGIYVRDFSWQQR